MVLHGLFLGFGIGTPACDGLVDRLIAWNQVELFGGGDLRFAILRRA